MSIRFFDGFPPQVTMGYIVSFEEKATKQNGNYAHVLLDIPSRVKKEVVVERCPFYFGPKIWGLYKNKIKSGQLWRFHYRLTGNKAGNKYYLNASVVQAIYHWNEIAKDDKTSQPKKESKRNGNSASSENFEPQSVPVAPKNSRESVLNEINFDEEIF